MIDRMIELQKDNQGLESREHFLAERVFNRATGAPLVTGNRVRILKNAVENYPAWLDAICAAEKTIYFESYILYDDEYGEQFAEMLMAKAREGVKVRLIYDWFGSLGKTSHRFWRRLMDAGVEVRAFNPPFFDSPFGWFSRDHRKMIAIDGRVGFVSGLCVGSMWMGDAARGIEPWRDTGVEVRGPAVAEIERAFSQVWSVVGSPMPANEIASRDLIAPAGDVALRVVASAPNSAWLYRLDQLIAASARETLWLTDAYFAGTTPYVQALRTAAMDDVDVRLLVPRATDIPVVRAISRAGYRPLLEAGVRIFEWNGTMLHAKTAVADGKWARVGSTNLNLSSWIGNWELDVVVEDKRFAEGMEELYLQDLENATEVVLNEKRRVAETERRYRLGRRKRLAKGSSGRMAAGAVSIGSAVKAAIANRRLLGPAEARSLGSVACLMLLLFVVAVMWPHVIAVPVAVFCLWLAISLAIRAFKLHRQGKREIDEANRAAESRNLQHP